MNSQRWAIKGNGKSWIFPDAKNPFEAWELFLSVIGFRPEAITGELVLSYIKDGYTTELRTEKTPVSRWAIYSPSGRRIAGTTANNEGEAWRLFCPDQERYNAYFTLGFHVRAIQGTEPEFNFDVWTGPRK